MNEIEKPQTRKLIFNKYKGHCAYCGCEIFINKFHIDHKMPLRRGTNDSELKESIRGKNSIDNFNPSCISCNSSKNEMSIETWRKELSLKIMRLNRDSSQYRLMKRFGLIIETKNEIIFYFEKHEQEIY
jgi:5-methylcytosine-specific restriction endonuclease McrA